MGKKQSSFHMGNEFNGYGEIRYLKGSRPGINPPVSQENIRISPNFGDHLLNMLGGIPIVTNLSDISPELLSLMGAIARVNQVIITKDEATGKYVFRFNAVSAHDFTDGSYPQYNQ